MRNFRILFIGIALFCVPFLLADTYPVKERVMPPAGTGAFEHPTALVQFDTLLPDLYNTLFAGSGVCVTCHGFDTLGIASVDAMGHDVNVVDDWRATMMGNSAKDPFWRAKVSHETLLHPQYQSEIEDKCTSCHAPLGHFNAHHTGLSHYSMDDLANDEIAKDGVSCLACHQMSATALGTRFSGLLQYDTFPVAYGPYENPLVSPMLTETGYKPVFSEHISDAGLCAGCHTLLTETVDLAGNFTGQTFVEQATYHEWLNSAYEDSVSCQGCHMPNLDKFPVYLVTGSQTEPRNPFFLHEFAGANVTMLQLLRDNIETLGLKASAEQFSDVIDRTKNMLQNRSLLLNLEEVNRTPDTAYIDVSLTNLAGHKFPSGYPSRRAFIELLVQQENGDTVFISGKMDANFEVEGQNPTYEPHYQVIRKEDQVQIYELVLGDVNNDVTTVLVRADHPIKDNRLPPIGFKLADPVYDTTRIAGLALSDSDFNLENGTEGSGSDRVHYHIPTSGNLDMLHVSAKVYYQSVPPKWMKEMFDESTPEIESFRGMFDAADRTPVLVKEASLWLQPVSSVNGSLNRAPFAKVFPVPTEDGMVSVQATMAHQLQVYSLDGILLGQYQKDGGAYSLQLPAKGIFLLRFIDAEGRIQTERVIAR